MNADQFPILGAQDSIITPVSGFAWLVLIQQKSDADNAMTSFMADKMKGLPPPPPKPPPPDFLQYPQFSAKGVGAFAIPDAAWIALVRQGDSVAQGPNPTERAIMQFVASFGRKVPRKP